MRHLSMEEPAVFDGHLRESGSGWWYVSFAADDDGHWLGAVIATADTHTEAVWELHRRDLLLSSSMLSFEIPGDLLPSEEFRWAILDRATLQDLDRVLGGEGAVWGSYDGIDLS